MITLSILFIFFGCFFFYNTSKKALLEQNLSIEKWTQKNQKPAKFIGSIAFLSSLAIAIKSLGLGSGIFFWLAVIMAVLSIYVLLFPLKRIKYFHIIVFIFLISILELFI